MLTIQNRKDYGALIVVFLLVVISIYFSSTKIKYSDKVTGALTEPSISYLEIVGLQDNQIAGTTDLISNLIIKINDPSLQVSTITIYTDNIANEVKVLDSKIVDNSLYITTNFPFPPLFASDGLFQDGSHTLRIVVNDDTENTYLNQLMKH